MNEYYDPTEISRIAQMIVSDLATKEGATVIGLTGDLGAGKTTLTQEIARLMGISETVVSPTFVIAKFYDANHPGFDMLAHMDAYRIESLDELASLGFESLLARPKTVLVVEWPERIKDALPHDIAQYHISHEGAGRRITYEKNS